MMIDVANIPASPPSGRESICVVIDVLRASSTITYLFDKGTQEVWLTDTVSSYLNKGDDDREGLKICAEDVSGRCLHGADFSPSLDDISLNDLVFSGPVLMQTTNGTKAVHKLLEYGMDIVLIGCMRNATSVMEFALELAEELNRDIYIVCAGREYATSYSIDDVYCAGYLVRSAQTVAKKRGVLVSLNDSAKLACIVLDSFSNAIEAFNASASGYVMRNINKSNDILLCAQTDVSRTVPILKGETSDGFLRIVSLNCS
mgnify:CR=1 FL=1